MKYFKNTEEAMDYIEKAFARRKPRRPYSWYRINEALEKFGSVKLSIGEVTLIKD